MDLTLDGRTSFLIPEEPKQLSLKTLRPSLSLTETTCFWQNAYSATAVVVLGNVYVLLWLPRMT